jgi:hypothetical protein
MITSNLTHEGAKYLAIIDTTTFNSFTDDHYPSV